MRGVVSRPKPSEGLRTAIPAASVYPGVIASNAASVTDYVSVVLDDFDNGGQPWDRCPFNAIPRDDEAGGPILPVRGDVCWVSFTRCGDAVIVTWRPTSGS